MRNIGEKFINFILTIGILFIFSLTVYFCVDVLGIVDIPEQYSLINFIYSKVKVIQVADSSDDEDVNYNFNDTVTENVKRVFEKKEASNSETNSYDLDSIYSSNEIYYNESQTLSATSGGFYYNQLDEYGQKIYSELYNHKEDLKTGLYTADFGTTFDDLLHTENGADVLENSFQLAVNALTFDNPDIFYIDVTKMYLLTEITTKAFSKTYRVSVGPNGESYLLNEFGSKENVDSAVNAIEEVKNKIEFNAVGDDVSKIKLVHDYLVSNIEYYSTDSTHNIYNIYGAFIDGQSVCEGYAKSFKYILDDLGIPCIIACGVGQNSSGKTESHAWNYVELDGKWYAVDVTWDDPVIIGGTKMNNDIRYEYFLVGSNKFFEDHEEDGDIIDNANFTYPTLSEENY